MIMGSTSIPQSPSLQEFLSYPRSGMEWLEGQVVAKYHEPDYESDSGLMTIHPGILQMRVAFYWRCYLLKHKQGGEICTEAPCQTIKQVRRPDVAYLTPELLAQYHHAKVLPQSFPLIAEIASPDDSAEDLFAKAREYLQSGSLEVWLVFPDSQWLLILTETQHRFLTGNQDITSLKVLQDLKIPYPELFQFNAVNDGCTNV